MRRRNHAQRLRTAVEMLPERTQEAMLRGISANEIIVGAYTDGDGGICPMLAAHRNGGRTDFASFARAWDAYTGAKRARSATRREIRTLRSYLETSMYGETAKVSLGAVVEDVRRTRRKTAERAAWLASAGEGATETITARRLDVLDATAAGEREVDRDREAARAQR